MKTLLEVKNYLSTKYHLLEEIEIFLRSDEMLIIEKWNWDYTEALQFQTECVNLVLENERWMFFIFCSHPAIFTMGRGLQKMKNDVAFELVELNESHRQHLNLPVVDIKRGGGLTFHHPGQLVFYPILKTTKYDLKVHDFMLSILGILRTSLSHYLNSDDLIVNKDLLGLWHKNQFKLASIGLAVNRFVTYHGLAFNFYPDTIMQEELTKVFPCGLPGNIYRSLSELSYQSLSKDHFNEFKMTFQQLFYEMMDKQRSSSPTIDLISHDSSEENLLASRLKTERSSS